MIKKVKNTVPRTYVLSDLKCKEIIGTFYKNCKKQISQSVDLKKVMKRKSDELYVKWKGYDSSFNSWIRKKHITL